MENNETPRESKTYKAMLQEVEAIVENLDDQDVDLDHMLGQVERGYTLIKQMRERLDSTREKLETLRIEHETNNA